MAPDDGAVAFALALALLRDRDASQGSGAMRFFGVARHAKHPDLRASLYDIAAAPPKEGEDPKWQYFVSTRSTGTFTVPYRGILARAAGGSERTLEMGAVHEFHGTKGGDLIFRHTEYERRVGFIRELASERPDHGAIVEHAIYPNTNTFGVAGTPIDRGRIRRGSASVIGATHLDVLRVQYEWLSASVDYTVDRRNVIIGTGSIADDESRGSCIESALGRHIDADGLALMGLARGLPWATIECAIGPAEVVRLHIDRRQSIEVFRNERGTVTVVDGRVDTVEPAVKAGWTLAATAVFPQRPPTRAADARYPKSTFVGFAAFLDEFYGALVDARWGLVAGWVDFDAVANSDNALRDVGVRNHDDLVRLLRTGKVRWLFPSGETPAVERRRGRMEVRQGDICWIFSAVEGGFALTGLKVETQPQ